MTVGSWHRVAASTEVATGRPVRIDAAGQRFALYRRRGGAPVLMPDACIHQSGWLSDGWLTEDGDGIACPNHGWEFDASGACTRIPANRDGLPIPASLRTPTFRCEERDGAVWALLDTHQDDHDNQNGAPA